MTMFSPKPPFNLAEFLAKPASAAEIQKAKELRRRKAWLMSSNKPSAQTS